MQSPVSSPSSSALFSPMRMGDITLQNRIVMAPMTRNRAGQGNVPSTLNAHYYRQRATAGLIITEAAQVSPQAAAFPSTPGIHNKNQVEGWKGVSSAVHEKGGKVFMQLWHVGRINPNCPVSELTGIVNDYRLAAINAKIACFDGIEIHAANGYLLDQFLREGSNPRTDGYGGTLKNRPRLLLEVLDALLTVWPANRVGIKLSPSCILKGVDDTDPQALFKYVAQQLNAYSLAYLHVEEGHEAVMKYGADGLTDTSALVPTSFFRDIYEGQLMVSGGYSFENAQTAIANNEADLIAFGRLFVANPDLPARLQKGVHLNEADPTTFYGGSEKGYTDYLSLR
ncbi:MAG: alkene reductase [Limnobacter sp.]|nr:alkene reductase [Limnobacter sp.]